MREHKVISPFNWLGTVVPKGRWTPPTEAAAAKYIAAGCLVAPPEVESAPVTEPEETEATETASEPEDVPPEPPKRKTRGRTRR